MKKIISALYFNELGKREEVPSRVAFLNEAVILAGSPLVHMGHGVSHFSLAYNHKKDNQFKGIKDTIYEFKDMQQLQENSFDINILDSIINNSYKKLTYDLVDFEVSNGGLLINTSEKHFDYEFMGYSIGKVYIYRVNEHVVEKVNKANVDRNGKVDEYIGKRENLKFWNGYGQFDTDDILIVTTAEIKKKDLQEIHRLKRVDQFDKKTVLKKLKELEKNNITNELNESYIIIY
ncbi:hypothetical protein RJG79_02510 [Mycoplasmatota bacterium WC44]